MYGAITKKELRRRLYSSFLSFMAMIPHKVTFVHPASTNFSESTIIIIAMHANMLRKNCSEKHWNSRDVLCKCLLYKRIVFLLYLTSITFINETKFYLEGKFRANCHSILHCALWNLATLLLNMSTLSVNWALVVYTHCLFTKFFILLYTTLLYNSSSLARIHR